MCCSPQEIIKKGRAEANTARTAVFGMMLRLATIAGRRNATMKSIGSAPRVTRPATRVNGDVSSTMILMKRKDAPQIQPSIARTKTARVLNDGSLP
jgi:hypothetical protein